MNDGHKLVFFQVRANKSQICKTFFPHDFGHQHEFNFIWYFYRNSLSDNLGQLIT